MAIDAFPHDPRLTVVMVNYQSWPEALRLALELEAEPELKRGQCEIVIVDNASTGPIPGLLLVPRAGLRLIERHDNGGFAVGVNAGCRAARGRWLLVLNPDVEIEPGFLSQVLARIAHHERAPEGVPGIVGFGLKNSDGSRQGSVGAFPSLGRAVWEQLLPRGRRKYQPAWRIRSGPVDWVTGCCMLVNRAMIDDLGGMDEDFFLYYEEVAFSRSAQRRGWRVVFDDQASVIHRHPLQNRPVSPKMRVILRHSKLLYFLKHLPAWQFLVLDGIVGIEAAVRGWCSTRLGRSADARAWRTIGMIATRLRRDGGPRGREVLTLAEGVESAAAGGIGAGRGPLGRPAARSTSTRETI